MNSAYSHREQEKLRHRKLVSQTIVAASLIPGLVDNGKMRGSIAKSTKYLTDYLKFLHIFKHILISEYQTIDRYKCDKQVSEEPLFYKSSNNNIDDSGYIEI